MPSTLVHVAFGAIIATALLGAAFDRRSILVVLAIVAAADLDSFAGLVIEGGHRSVGHTLLLPLGASLLVALDTLWREHVPLIVDRSWLRVWYDGDGVRVAWVGIVTFTLAAVGLDLVMSGRFGGVNLFYPFHDQFYQFDGRAFYSTKRGLVQTFVELTQEQTASGTRTGIDAGQKGTSKEVHISNPIDPSKGKEPENVERIVPLVASGWQLWMLVTGAFVLTARFWEER